MAASTLGFFPGFPFLIRIVHLIVGLSWPASAAAAELLTQLFMVIAVWVLAADTWNDTIADRSILLLVFFPGASILALLYAEPLLIGLAAVTLLALSRQRWLVAGIGAAAASIVRPNGISLLVPCVLAAWSAMRERREWRSLISVALAPTGLIAWFAYLAASTGSALAYVHTQAGGWGEHFDVIAFPRLVHVLLRQGILHFPNEYVTVASSIVGFVLFVYACRAHLPATWVAYSAAVLLTAMFSTATGIRPRILFTAFPLVLAMGPRLKDYSLALLVAAGSVLGTGLLIQATATTKFTP